jgi:dephospho-CoA kinase
VEAFGPAILDVEGRIDRKQLAGYVFQNPERLEELNSIVHPAVIRREEQFIADVAAADPNAIVVVEAAILIETGSYRRFDCLILVVCSEEQQIERAMHRDGCTRREAEARLRRQMPLEEKRKFADYVIDTSGPRESTAEQARRVYEALRSMRK